MYIWFHWLTVLLDIGICVFCFAYHVQQKLVTDDHTLIKADIHPKLMTHWLDLEIERWIIVFIQIWNRLNFFVNGYWWGGIYVW